MQDQEKHSFFLILSSVSKNCEQHHSNTLHFSVNCGSPDPPVYGELSYISHTREGAIITFWCSSGFRPSTVMNSTCTNNGSWFPLPRQHTCTLVEGKFNLVHA